MTLAEKLNAYDVSVAYGVSQRGGVTAPTLQTCPDDSLLNEYGVVDPGLDAFLDEVGKAEVFFDDDPRDRRAGVVRHVRLSGEGAWYDEHGDCCWKDLTL